MLHDIIIYTPMYVTFLWCIILLASPRKDNIAKQYLGVFMFMAFILYLCHAVFFQGQRSSYLFFEPLYTFSSLMIYPLYYIYIRVLSKDLPFSPKNIKLFIPALFFSLSSILIYTLMDSGERMDYANGFLFQKDLDLLSSPLQKIQGGLYMLNRMTFAIQVIYFLVLGSRLVVKYNHRIANFYSNLERKNLNWVNVLLLAFVFGSFASFILNLIGKIYFFESPFLLFIPSFIFSSLFFMIGLQGFFQNHSASDLILEENQNIDEIENDEYSQNRNNHLKEKLIKVFEEDKIYRNSELRIIDVSIILHTNRTYVSKLINQDFKASFSEFVNQYRINEAKELLKSQATEKFTLEYVSESVGFGSLHTFIRVFKESEGLTPGRFRDKK